MLSLELDEEEKAALQNAALETVVKAVVSSDNICGIVIAKQTGSLMADCLLSAYSNCLEIRFNN